MNEEQKLKLLVIYDASRNEYQLAGHNQSAEEAAAFAEKRNPHLIPGATLITLDQARRHGAVNVQGCRACRETVVRSARLTPQPHFRRREP